MPFCGQCGTKVDEGTRFCPNCGGPMAPGAIPAQYAAPGAIPLQYAAPPAYKPENPTGVGSILKKAFAVLKKKPVLLWGISLMATLLTVLAGVFGMIPIIVIPIVLALTAGIECVYLAGYRGEEINSGNLFVGFKSFWHTVGGMGWMALWILIWGLIPIVGPVFAIIKMYSYRFVPYILMNNPEISATEALRVSMKKTEGFKGKMFLVDFIIGLIVAGAFIILMLLCMIPYACYLFYLVTFAAWLVVIAGLPLLMGLVRAAFYDEIEKTSGKTE